MIASGYVVSFWGVKNILELDSGDGYMTVNVLNASELYTYN